MDDGFGQREARRTDKMNTEQAGAWEPFAGTADLVTLVLPYTQKLGEDLYKEVLQNKPLPPNELDILKELRELWYW